MGYKISEYLNCLRREVSLFFFTQKSQALVNCMAQVVVSQSGQLPPTPPIFFCVSSLLFALEPRLRPGKHCPRCKEQRRNKQAGAGGRQRYHVSVGQPTHSIVSAQNWRFRVLYAVIFLENRFSAFKYYRHILYYLHNS